MNPEIYIKLMPISGVISVDILSFLLGVLFIGMLDLYFTIKELRKR